MLGRSLRVSEFTVVRSAPNDNCVKIDAEAVRKMAAIFMIFIDCVIHDGGLRGLFAQVILRALRGRLRGRVYYRIVLLSYPQNWFDFLESLFSDTRKL